MSNTSIDIDAGVESTVLLSLHSIVVRTCITDDVRDYTRTSPAGSSDVKALHYNTVILYITSTAGYK